MKISIVTTAYNIEKYVEQCLTSILAQTYKDIEVIIVNDCSTDGTMDIVSKFTDDRIKVIDHEVNMGAGWARRHGIEAATGEYVITIDGDDWISPTFIEDLAKNAEETKADIISGGITIVKEELYHEIKRFLPHVSVGFAKIQDYNDQKIIFLNNKLVRRSMYEKVPYSTRRFCEDTPVILPLLYYANMVSYVDTQGYYYRQHGESLCRRVDKFDESLYKALCMVELDAFFADKGEDYAHLLNKKEFIGYIKNIKYNMTADKVKQYSSELAELTPAILNIIEL